MADSKFAEKASGNPVGRPKGSRNKITLAKLVAEEAVRSGNMEDMVEVCRLVVQDALEGDFRYRKLIWESVVTKAPSEATSTGKDKVEIVINSSAPTEIKPTETVIVAEYTDTEE
tara:strand:+ start:565 stop:909 length:345 start_codon:yes stop_codon:yes gene_type:complete